MIKPIILKQARPETIIKNYSMNRPLSVNITTRTKTHFILIIRMSIYFGTYIFEPYLNTHQHSPVNEGIMCNIKPTA